NGTPYGLSSSLCTNRMDLITRFIQELEVGSVNVREVPGYRLEMTPFGGIKDSGLGYKEGVLEAMKSFTNTKTYSLPWKPARAQHGQHGHLGSDGRNRTASVGPSYGPQRHRARLRRGSAPPAWDRSAKQAPGLPRGRIRHGTLAEQHRDRADGRFVRDRRHAGPRPGARRYAGRERGHDARRAGLVVQHRHPDAHSASRRRDRVQAQRQNPDPRSRASLDR